MTSGPVLTTHRLSPFPLNQKHRTPRLRRSNRAAVTFLHEVVNGWISERILSAQTDELEVLAVGTLSDLHSLDPAGRAIARHNNTPEPETRANTRQQRPLDSVCSVA